MTKPGNIDQYISTFPEDVQEKLEAVRKAIRDAAPGATEKISYAMPTFFHHGNLIHFAAFTNHIGVYALPSGNEAFRDQLSKYRVGKGSIQFPFSQPLPLDLIAEITKFRVQENEEKAMLKKKK